MIFGFHPVFQIELLEAFVLILKKNPTLMSVETWSEISVVSFLVKMTGVVK